ncbi:MAG: hypothetical protein NZ820_02215 [Dehalococcoidia bacterium]|nr:hypothetical protein [Dehalococcoidia bacterium]
MDVDGDSEGWDETQYETLDWGDEEESGGSLVALYPATSKPTQAAITLIFAGFVLLGTATMMNGILNDEKSVEGMTVKSNEMMGEMGIEIEQEEEEIDESFVRKILKFGMIAELICAILAFVGGALLMMRQNYNMALIGCAAAIAGLGIFLLSTLLGAIALYLTFQSRPEFGMAEQDESW